MRNRIWAAMREGYLSPVFVKETDHNKAVIDRARVKAAGDQRSGGREGGFVCFMYLSSIDIYLMGLGYRFAYPVHRYLLTLHSSSQDGT